MPAPQRLSNGSITPRANPVSTFLQYNSDPTPAVPVQPSKLPQVSRITSFQRGGRPSVQGVNPIQELTDALKPLSSIFNAGAEMYASSEYKKGQNEILKAASNINRDTIQKSYLYAEQNRAVHAQNPIAGVLMDEANPFRKAGRENQASQFVASQVAGQFRAEWARTGGNLGKVDPADPAVLATQAKVTTHLVNAFGLNEFSPGFQQYVVPQINKGWEWFQSQQFSAHVKHQKAVGATQVARTLAASLMGMNGPTPEGWLEIIGQHEATYGLTGEGAKMTKAAILQTHEMLQIMKADPNQRQAAQAALSRLMLMPSGIFDQAGQSINVGQAFSGDLLGDHADVARDMKVLRDAMKEEAELNLDEIITQNPEIGNLSPQDPAFQGLYEEWRADPRLSALSDQELKDKVAAISGQNREIQAIVFDRDKVDNFLEDVTYAVGSEYDEGVAAAQFRKLMQDAPQGVRQELLADWDKIKRQKRLDQESEVSATIMNKSMDKFSTALVSTVFPKEGLGLITGAEERGVDLVEYMTTLKGDKANTVARVQNYIRQKGLQQIRKETAENKGPLSLARQSEIWAEVNDSVLGDQKVMDRLTGRKPREEVTPEEPKQEVNVTPQSYYNIDQNVPSERARSASPSYERGDVEKLLQSLSNGKSIPSAVKRAAREAGLTPGQFVLRQADIYQMQLPPEIPRLILQLDNQSMGLESIRSAPGSGPVALATSPTMEILTGIAPSYRQLA